MIIKWTQCKILRLGLNMGYNGVSRRIVCNWASSESSSALLYKVFWEKQGNKVYLDVIKEAVRSFVGWRVNESETKNKAIRPVGLFMRDPCDLTSRRSKVIKHVRNRCGMTDANVAVIPGIGPLTRKSNKRVNLEKERERDSVFRASDERERR